MRINWKSIIAASFVTTLAYTLMFFIAGVTPIFIDIVFGVIVSLFLGQLFPLDFLED